jgi:HAE1 family hydrophobic/amphiphilic exporter-1
MDLVASFVNNPVKVSVGVLLVVMFGLLALTTMPMQLTPEVEIPTLTVETTWPGASPHEVEQEIVREQEEQLKSVEGITKLSSESMDSMGRITMEFAVGTNMDQALLKVNSRLQQVPVYPENADKPIITTSNSSNTPIAWFILGPRPPSRAELERFQAAHPELSEALDPIIRCHNVALQIYRLRRAAQEHPEMQELLPPDIDVAKLRKFAEDYIEAAFERVNGVSNSNVFGGLEEELQVIVNPEELAARQLTISDVRNVLRGQNRDTSGGDFWEGKRRWVVRTLGQFRSPEQVENQLLAVRNGAPVYVRDVAEVRLGYKKPDGVVRRFGDSSIAVNCVRETGANVLDVMEGLREANRRLNEELLAPRGLQLTQVYDETEYIHSAVGLVRENIFLGGALTLVVLMVFLHLNLRTLIFGPLIIFTGWASVYWSEWWFALCVALVVFAGLWYARGSLIVALPIPVSIIGTFLFMSVLGRSLNVISLAGLAFAVGMLVDNGVVVLENIFSHYQRGEPPFQAAVKGAGEVWSAIVTSSLTNLAIFLPVLFVQEEAGQLFRDIALAISGAVGLSIFVAIAVVPPAAARLLSHARHDAPQPSGNGRAVERRTTAVDYIIGVFEGFASGFVAIVDAVNAFVLRSPLRQLAVTLAFLASSVLLTIVFWPPVEYLPNGNKNLVFGIMLPPPGYNLDELTTMGQEVEESLREYWDVSPDELESGKRTKPIIGDFFFVARGRQVFLGARSYDPTRAAELIPVIMQVGRKFPGTILVAFQSSLFAQGLTAGRTIDVEITGPELEQLVSLGRRVLVGDMPPTPDAVVPKGVMALIPNCQARPVPSLDLSSPELHVEPRLLQSSEMGMSAAELGYTVDALVDGAYASDYIQGADKIDLTIRGRDEFARQTQDVAGLPISTPAGQLVPLAALADVTLSSGPEQINHRERERAITIQVTPPPEMPLEQAMTLIQSNIVEPLQNSGQLQGGYRITLAGTADKLRQTWDALWFNFALAIIITYLLMAALYESWLYPFVIILSVPLGAVGGLMGLQALSWYLMIGGHPPQTLDVLTMLGFVILIGTVVNNPILIVDVALQQIRENGASAAMAVREAVRSRIRPIFMTAITTLLGLFPLVLFPGAGSELYRGLGAVLLGGLSVSTIFTLFFIPAVFALMMELQGTFAERLRRKESAGGGLPAPGENGVKPPEAERNVERRGVGVEG